MTANYSEQLTHSLGQTGAIAGHWLRSGRYRAASLRSPFVTLCADSPSPPASTSASRGPRFALALQRFGHGARLLGSGDALRADPIREQLEYGGLRLRTTAALARARISITVDIGFGDAVEPSVGEVDLPVLLDQARAQLQKEGHGLGVLPQRR